MIETAHHADRAGHCQKSPSRICGSGTKACARAKISHRSYFFPQSVITKDQLTAGKCNADMVCSHVVSQRTLYPVTSSTPPAMTSHSGTFLVIASETRKIAPPIALHQREPHVAPHLKKKFEQCAVRLHLPLFSYVWRFRRAIQPR